MSGKYRQLFSAKFLQFRIFRRIIQTVSLFGTNLYYQGWLSGDIFTGQSKMFCIPGLHCYSCPSSVLACPIGSLQSIVSTNGFMAGITTGNPDSIIVLGVLGFLLVIGFTAGRIACGWVCPFGLLQEMLYKIPLPKKTIPPSWRHAKYVVLLVFAILLPMTLKLTPGAGGDPWFCKAICPSGTLTAGWPLVLYDTQGILDPGFLFTWKSLVLGVILLWAMISKRPFCRVICPLGAFWGVAGKASVFKMRVDNKCIECGICKQICAVDIAIYREQKSAECIRCGECIKICPVNAIHHDTGGDR